MSADGRVHPDVEASGQFSGLCAGSIIQVHCSTSSLTITRSFGYGTWTHARDFVCVAVGVRVRASTSGQKLLICSKKSLVQMWHNRAAKQLEVIVDGKHVQKVRICRLNFRLLSLAQYFVVVMLFCVSLFGRTDVHLCEGRNGHSAPRSLCFCGTINAVLHTLPCNSEVLNR